MSQTTTLREIGSYEPVAGTDDKFAVVVSHVRPWFFWGQPREETVTGTITQLQSVADQFKEEAATYMALWSVNPGANAMYISCAAENDAKANIVSRTLKKIVTSQAHL